MNEEEQKIEEALADLEAEKAKLEASNAELKVEAIVLKTDNDIALTEELDEHDKKD